MSGRKTRRPGEIAIPLGSGFGKGHTCTCWPRPDDSCPCTPQTCDWRCRACRSYGRPFYSRDELQYLEHDAGPLAAELERLWRAKGRASAAPSEQQRATTPTAGRRCRGGAAGLARRRPQARTVTDLYYPGLGDPPPGHGGRNAGSR